MNFWKTTLAYIEERLHTAQAVMRMVVRTEPSLVPVFSYRTLLLNVPAVFTNSKFSFERAFC